MKNKHILYLSPLNKHGVKGGIVTWTSRVLENGLPDGYTFTIVDTSILGKRDIFNKYKFSLILEFIRNIRIISSLIISIIKNKPSLAHFNCSISPYGLFRDFICLKVIKFFSIPVVVHYRGNLPQSWETNNSFYVSKAVLKNLINSSNMNLAMNKYSINYLNSLSSQPNKNFIVESFIDNSVFSFEKKYKDNSDIEIIYVGAFAKAKGAVEIIKLAKLFSDLRFTVIGKVSSDMSAYTKELPDNIKLRHQVGHQEVFKYLLQADIFLFLSHSEGFPNAVLEAMAVGLPIIATRVGAIEAMIEVNSGGFLSDVGEIKEIEKSIKVLVKDLALRKSMGSFNKIKAKEQYSYDVVVKKLTALYDNLIIDK